MRRASTKKQRKIRKKIVKIIDWQNVLPEKRILLLTLIAANLITATVVAFRYAVPEKKPFVAYEAQQKKNPELEREIKKLVQGYPIESMVPYIAEKDKDVAAFLVSIAKKESNWGKRIPVLNGENCYNYWGFRLKAEKMGSGGHTCFDNPQEAVDVVAQRINQLVKEESIDTPKEMVIWKCGYKCNGPEAIGATKWVRDVDYYYSQLIN